MCKRPFYAARPIFWITLLAEILRLLLIQSPDIWGDEAYTYARVSGTYRQLILALRETVFAPLHYQAMWVIGHYFWLTPPVLRMLAIISGILIVPAIYFLARQLVSRQAANLVALFTACSAYMLVYSRDAKMYPEFWLCGILSVGLFIRWLRRGDATGYLAWLAASLAMVGLDSLGFIILALAPILQISAKRPTWKKAVLTLAGLTIVSAGPAIYYNHFNKLVARSQEDQFSEGTGTMWVAPYNQGRTGFEHLRYLVSTYLVSWEWPRAQDIAAINPRMLFWLKWATVGLLVMAAVGLLPWWHRLRSRMRGGWRTGLWLAVWLIVPTYVFYCRSLRPFLSPLEIGKHLAGNRLGMAGGILAGVLIVAWLWQTIGWRGLLRAAGRLAIIIAVVLGLCQIIYRISPPSAEGSIWFPRYLAINWPAFAIALCWAISRIPLRAVRLAVVGLLLVVNLQRFVNRICLSVNVDARGHWIVEGTEPPLDLMAQDVVDSDTPRREMIGRRLVTWRPHSDTRTYVMHEPAEIGHPGEGTLLSPPGRYYLAVLGLIIRPVDDTRGLMMPRQVFQIDENTRPRFIAQDVAGSAQIHRVIVWEKIDPNDPSQPDMLIRLLGAKWHLLNEMQFPVQQHWRGTQTRTLRRREYVLRGL